MGDWLGTGRHHGGWRPFKDARAFVRHLGFKSQAEWLGYCKSGRKPIDIPSNPQKTYATAGWAGLVDWLGNGRHNGSGWRPFNNARRFVRGLSLKSEAEWRHYCKSGKRPTDIPNKPDSVYAGAGWENWGNSPAKPPATPERIEAVLRLRDQCNG
jgi:hypothetical protein